LKRGVTLDDSLVKTLSETKVLTGELKGRDAAPYVNAAALVLLSNHLPALTDTSAGLVDRINAIPFHARFEPGANRTGQEKAAAILRDELPGILNMALAGLHRLVKRGYFDQPDACQALARRWLDEANPLGWFWRECVEATGQEADKLEMETARESYNGFVTMHGLGHSALTQAVFGKRIREEFNPRIAQLKVSTLVGYRLIKETTLSDFEAAGIG
jgi:phage/plasmid-associated DNA primase